MKFTNSIYKLIICFCMFLLVHANVTGQSKKGTVTLKGTLKNFNNQVEIEDMSAFQYLLPGSTKRMIIPDSAGNFSISFSVDGPGYYRLGRNQLYLSPGDDLELFVDKANPRLATFKGKGTEANNYLRDTPFPKGGSFINAGSLVKSSPEETM